MCGFPAYPHLEEIRLTTDLLVPMLLLRTCHCFIDLPAQPLCVFTQPLCTVQLTWHGVNVSAHGQSANMWTRMHKLSITTELLKLRLPLTNTIAQFHGLRHRRLFLPIQHVVIRDPIAKLVTFSPVAASTLARSTQCPTKLCPLSEVDNGVLTQIRTPSYNRAWARLFVKPVRPTRYTHTCVPVNRRTLIHTSPCLTTACLQAGVLSTNNADLYYTTQLTVLVYSRCFVLSINC